MLATILALVKAQLATGGNQFLAGGLGLMVVGWIGYQLKSLPTRIWDFFLFHFSVRVDVQSTDRAYHWLLIWLESQPYNKRARRISIRDVKLKDGDHQQILVPARGHHWFLHKGLPIWIRRDKDDGGAPSDALASPNNMAAFVAPRELISIRTIGRSRTKINAIIEQAKAKYQVNSTGKLRIMYNRWSDWSEMLKPKRPIESVFLPASADNLLADIKRFIDSAEWYRKLGIPYRRGYLFFGPPGTGKTSSAEAIAGHFDLPIYVLNLANMSSGSAFEQAIMDINNVGPAILLIEDIDTAIAPKRVVDDDDDTLKPATVVPQPPSVEKVNIGTLLNGLDGILSQDSLILIMTSNHPEKLDRALLRKGRVDLEVEFGMASDEQIAAAVSRFLPDIDCDTMTEIKKWPKPISLADVQERLKTLALANTTRKAA